MNRQASIIIVGFFLLVWTSCKTTQTGLIIGDNYDEKKNQTTLTILPYGSIVVPGKWTKTSYNRISKQHFFRSNDSTTIALAKNPKHTYPFYKSEQSNKDFLTEFTKWESDYFKEHGATITIIEDQSDKGYILWKATIEAGHINTIYLYGLKGDYAYNLSGDSKTWTEKKIHDFLVILFNDN